MKAKLIRTNLSYTLPHCTMLRYKLSKVMRENSCWLGWDISIDGCGCALGNFEMRLLHSIFVALNTRMEGPDANHPLVAAAAVVAIALWQL